MNEPPNRFVCNVCLRDATHQHMYRVRCLWWYRVVRTMTYMFFLIHLETCGYFSISAYVGLGTDEWVYDGTGTASVS